MPFVTNFMSSFRTLVLPVLTLVLFGISFHLPAIATSGINLVAGKGPLGQSLETWAIKYWQWFATLPSGFENNPCLIYSVPNAPMVFLINSWTQEYSGNCTISSDKYVLVPLLIGECDPTLPEAKSGTLEDLQSCAKAADEPFESWDIVLDDTVISRKWGNQVINPNIVQDLLVRNSAMFTINIPKNNHFDAAPGSYPAVVDGYYLVLNPLPIGEHKLSYKINQEKVGAGMANVPTLVGGSATYNLQVK
jgi:hypothetical protein